MIYVEFMKNFFLPDSSKLLGVRFILASWAQKRLIPTLQTFCTSNSWEIFFSPIRANWWVLDFFRLPQPKNVSFLFSRQHVRRVHEKYLLADSSQLMGVRLISASWAQKRLIPTLPTSCTSNSLEIFFPPIRGNWDPKTFDSYFLDMIYVEFMKKFFLADSSKLLGVRFILASCELMGVRLISVSWAKKRLILTFYTSCTSSLLKAFISPIRQGDGIRRVHEKLFSRRYERAVGCFTHFGLLSPKTFYSYFTDIMYVEFMRNVFLADSSELMSVSLIFASWAQKRLIPTF